MGGTISLLYAGTFPERVKKLVLIEGIGPVYAAKLEQVGVRTTDALLKKGSKPEDRRLLAEASGIGAHLILEWVNLADLYRIKGVGSQYSDLLEEAYRNILIG